MDVAKLEERLESTRPTPKFLYYTPNFHNPAGIIYSRKVKQQMMELLKGRTYRLSRMTSTATSTSMRRISRR